MYIPRMHFKWDFEIKKRKTLLLPAPLWWEMNHLGTFIVDAKKYFNLNFLVKQTQADVLVYVFSPKKCTPASFQNYI